METPYVRMETPHVDIVMATNRVGSYLATTLESVRQQTFASWRLIVVDDGTPDTTAVARAVAGLPRTTVIRQENRGLAAARNRGIAVGDAPLIALLDDDDIWAPDKLEAQVKSLEAVPTAVASFTAGRYIDGEGQEFGEGWPAHTVPSIRFVSGEVPTPRIVTLMVRRSAHEAIGGFNESYFMSEDNEYILRLAIAGEMAAVPRPLIAYRRHQGNVSVTGSLEGRLASKRLLSERLREHRHDPRVRALLSENMSRFQAASSVECLRGMADALRRRDGRRFVREMKWAAKAPAPTLRALSRVTRHHSATS